jgi:hypothetical protein
MRKLVLGLAAAVALSLCVRVSSAADDAKKVSGVLIDDHCAAGMMKKDDPEKAAAGHKVACALKCAKDNGHFVVISGKKELKLDKHGEELAMDYLSKPDAKTAVTITGTVMGDEIKVDSIMAKEKEASKG